MKQKERRIYDRRRITTQVKAIALYLRDLEPSSSYEKEREKPKIPLENKKSLQLLVSDAQFSGVSISLNARKPTRPTGAMFLSNQAVKR